MPSLLSESERAAIQGRFSELVNIGEYTKIGADISPYIKVRVYENSVCTALLKERVVQPSELIPEPGYNDTFYVMGSLEMMTKNSAPVNFRGQGEVFVPGGRRFKIPIGRHMTKVTTKSKDELMAFDYDLLADIGDKDIFELHTLRDKKFLQAANACALQTDKWNEYPLTGALTIVRPDKLHFNENAQMLESGKRTAFPQEDTLKATKHLMGMQLWRDLALWESEGAGGELVSSISINGYPASMIMGLTYVTSSKNVLYVHKDPVVYLTFTGIGVNDQIITIDGITYTFKDSAAGVTGDREINKGANATEAAANTYAVLVRDQESVNCLGANYEFTNPAEGIVRIRKIYDIDWYRFSPDPIVATENCTNASFGTVGYDYWDHIYTFPDPEYLGEMVKIAGQEIEVDIWSERGEKTTEVKRRSSEFSGGAIGNINGVALSRLQRYYYPA
ncbi:MAG: hypothetical protein WCY30_00095 [Candidatus Neomarinimicrobiota bacterium]|jgi:hypothetical protein